MRPTPSRNLKANGMPQSPRRALELNRRFDGILAWDSFFHLAMDDQRGMFPRFASHARAGAPLMFTSGPAEGETIGSFCGEHTIWLATYAAEPAASRAAQADSALRAPQDSAGAFGGRAGGLPTVIL